MSAAEWIALISGVCAILGALTKVARSLNRMNRDFCGVREAYKDIAKTNAVLLEASFGILDGLRQQGCNGKVTETYDMLLKHVVENRGGGLT